MIIRTLAEILGSERDVDWGHGRSRRLLLARDGMGYSLSDTTVDAGSETVLEYPQHLEACYCIEGVGEIEGMDGDVHPITPGTLYALDRHDRHVVRAKTAMRLVCVFMPALVGPESHRGGEGPGYGGEGSGPG